ncbi:hypothetical protein Cni_G02011 [Canna indica]|uniref:Uncharacterized protein n=1 Tax=Canna indica TaxID=4628 RepID=A0AAQ3JQI6_9LILI|nr:hypothetical protein Cni_G02011 [Canna indica]
MASWVRFSRTIISLLPSASAVIPSRSLPPASLSLPLSNPKPYRCLRLPFPLSHLPPPRSKPTGSASSVAAMSSSSYDKELAAAKKAASLAACLCQVRALPPVIDFCYFDRFKLEVVGVTCLGLKQR